MADWSVRPARLDDVDFLTRRSPFAAARQPGSLAGALPEETDWRAGYADWSRELIAEGPGLFVIEYAGSPVGRLRTAPADDALEVCGLQIMPSSQGLGIGTGLLRSLHDASPLVLGVEKDNPRARALYLRLGFVDVGQTDEEHRMRWA